MFKAKPLKYEFSSYEPFISAEIMDLHYTKHYFGYLNNLNNALQKYPEYFQLSVPEILEKIHEVPEDIRTVVRNNGGGVVNHELLWEILENKETSAPKGKLKEDIDRKFGSFDSFTKWFEAEVGKAFGSGWVWLVIDSKGDLKIITTPNQDSPYMNKNTPVFGIDIWEHAYYLQHKNGKLAYFKEIWKVLNWDLIEKKYTEILSKA